MERINPLYHSNFRMNFFPNAFLFAIFRFGTDSSNKEAYIGVGDGDIRVYHGAIGGETVKFQIKITKIQDPSTHKVNILE